MPDSLDDQIVLTVELRTAAGRQAEMREAVEQLVSATRSQDRGVVRFDVAIDPLDETRVIGFEIWQSQEALDEHAAKPHTVAFLERAGELVVDAQAPLSAERWRPLHPEAPMPYPPVLAAAQPPPQGFEHRTFPVSDADLHGVIGGSGPPLILLHGFPNTWYAWRAAMPRLADFHRVLALDLRGLGDSESGTRPNDVPTGVDDLLAVLDLLELDRAAIAGQDWGGSTAFAFARRHPERVSAVAVLEALPTGPWSPAGAASGTWFSEFQRIPELPETLVRGREAEYLGWFFEAFTSTPGVPSADAVAEYLRCYSREGSMSSGFARYRGVEQEIAFNSVEPAAPIEVPVLAIGGERVMGGLVAENLRQAVADVQEVVLAGAGHYLSEERPEEVADLLLELTGASRQ